MYSTLEHIVIKFETNVNSKRRVQLIINFIILQIPTKMALYFLFVFFQSCNNFLQMISGALRGLGKQIKSELTNSQRC